jgi:hypothetical protein
VRHPYPSYNRILKAIDEKMGPIRGAGSRSIGLCSAFYPYGGIPTILTAWGGINEGWFWPPLKSGVPYRRRLMFLAFILTIPKDMRP